MTDRRVVRLGALLLGWCAIAATAAPPATTAEPEDFAYHAQARDTLIGLGRRLLRDPRQWQAVQLRNHIADPRRIPDGSVLRIPYAWLKLAPEPAIVVAVAGAVTIAGRPIAVGDAVVEGSSVTTGSDGSVTLRLADGSVATVQKSSVLELRAMQRVLGAPGYDIRLSLHAGRISTQVRPHRDVGRFEIQTPVAISAVRGTEFRTSVVPDGTIGTTETLDGAVAVAGATGAVSVGAGFGTRVEHDAPPIPPVPLLPAPDLSGLPATSDARELVWPFPAVAGAARYRVQVAPDERFEALVRDLETEHAQIGVNDLADGHYCLRVRAVDRLSIEGVDGLHCYTQHALPPSPSMAAPAGEGRSVGQHTHFEWHEVPLAVGYRFEVARDAQFTQQVSARMLAGETHTDVDQLAPGRYFWRIAAVDAAGAAGHWANASAFVQVAAPPQPEPPRIDRHQVIVSWPGNADARYVLQIARDPAFARVLEEQSVTGPSATVDRPMPGRYYARVRVAGPPDAATDYGTVRTFDVPMPLWAKVLVSAVLVSPFL